jgi:hypothetical protein
MTISRQILLRMTNVLHNSCRENQNRHFMSRNFFPTIVCHLSDNVKKCGGTRGHKWRDSMVIMLCLLDKEGYTHARTHAPTQTYTYCYSTARFANVPHCYVIHTLSVLLYCLLCISFVHSFREYVIFYFFSLIIKIFRSLINVIQDDFNIKLLHEFFTVYVPLVDPWI